MSLLVIIAALWGLCKLLDAARNNAKERQRQRELARVKAEQARRAAEAARLREEWRKQQAEAKAETARLIALEREQMRLAREQKRQAEEQARQAEQLAKHEARIAELEFRMSQNPLNRRSERGGFFMCKTEKILPFFQNCLPFLFTLAPLRENGYFKSCQKSYFNIAKEGKNIMFSPSKVGRSGET